jgi:hypothetical protein
MNGPRNERLDALEAEVKFHANAPAEVREGWVLVPREPTCAMLSAMHDGPLMADDHEMGAKQVEFLTAMYKAALSAAPTPANASPASVAGDDDIALLVWRFAAALETKLRAAEVKYGHNDAWKRNDWRESLIRQLHEHIEKGDPRDVAAYCAFAWHHGWSLISEPPLTEEERRRPLFNPGESDSADQKIDYNPINGG